MQLQGSGLILLTLLTVPRLAWAETHEDERHVKACRLPLRASCTKDSDCESNFCLDDYAGNGPLICQPAALGKPCIVNSDCIASNCTYPHPGTSHCKQNGKIEKVGVCAKGTTACYYDEDCVGGCECFPASTTALAGYCFCD